MIEGESLSETQICCLQLSMHDLMKCCKHATVLHNILSNLKSHERVHTTLVAADKSLTVQFAHTHTHA